MKTRMAWLLVALLLCALPAAAQPVGDVTHEGYNITPSGLEIYLWENGTTGYQWSYEVDDPTVLVCQVDELVNSETSSQMVGAASMHKWQFNTGEDGEALLSFYYERAWETDDESIAPERTICFSVSVEGGKVTECEMEDLSEEDNEGDGEESFVPYQGETGGVQLDVFSGMSEQQTDEGTLLTSEDGLTTILIQYEPEDDPEALFTELKDEESAAKIYDDEATGQAVISCSVDREADPPCVTLVYYIANGIVEYTGYQAPNGGVLHEYTTYLLGEDIAEEDAQETDSAPVETDQPAEAETVS